MKDEIWKAIKGYEGLYEVSNLGRVRSLNYHREGKIRVMKSRVGKYGYLELLLHRNGKPKHYTVHRLVATAFLPNPDNLPQVNHIDECKTNNCLENLEWCDRKYNVNHGTGIKRRADKQRNNPNRSKRIYQYTKDGSFIRSYPSTHEAARRTKLSQRNISACARGAYGCKSAGNYRWSFDPPTSTTNRVLF